MGWISDHLGRSSAVVLGSAVYGGGLALVLLIKYGYILTPSILSIPLAAFAAAFCFGIGDCTFNTQTYAILGQLFGKNEHESVAAFTIFQFTQNIGSAVGFFTAPHLPLHGSDGTYWPVVIQAAVMVCAGVLFIFTYWGWCRPDEPAKTITEETVGYDATLDGYDTASIPDRKTRVPGEGSDY